MQAGAKRSVAMMAAACLLSCGCHKTAMVFGPSALPNALAPSQIDNDEAKKVAAKNQLPGIPFYNHYGVCTHETLWLEPQTTLSLTVTADDSKPVTESITLNNKAFHDEDAAVSAHNANSLVSALQEAVGKHTVTTQDTKYCPAQVAAHWDAVRDAYKVTHVDDTDPQAVQAARKDKVLLPVSNTATVGTAVDYSRVYYLNAKSPLIGTGTVDAKINTDGTLGEGSASVEDDTGADVLTAAATVASGGLAAWSGIEAARITGAATIAAAQAGFVATASEEEFREHAAPSPPALTCAAADGWPEVKTTVSYQFTLTPGGFKHDHVRIMPLEKETQGQCVAGDVVTDGSYMVTPLNGDSKPDDNAIGVSGTITMPKAKGDAKP